MAARQLRLVSAAAMFDAIREARVHLDAAEVEVRFAGVAHRPAANAVIEVEQAGLVGDFGRWPRGHEPARWRGRDRGLLVAGTVRPEATLAITNLLWILLGALGGIVIPAERLPVLAQAIVHYLPSGALGQALRDAFLSGSVNPAPVIVLLLWTAIAGGAATRWFKWN